MNWRNKAYDGPLPALAIRGPELRKSLRLVTVAYMYGMVHVSCVSGSQINIFSEMLGFNNFHFGLLTALPFLATFAQLAAAIPIERTGLRKHQFIECQLVSRLLWIAMAIVPLVLPVPSLQAVWVMLSLLLMISSLEAIGVPAWWTWIGDLIPRRLRGRYMASRETYSLVARLVAVIAIGILLDLVTKPETKTGGAAASADSQPLLLITICGLFILAGVLGVAVLLFRQIREIMPSIATSSRSVPTNLDAEPQPLRPLTSDYSRGSLGSVLAGVLLEPMRDKSFRSYAAFCATLTFGANISGMFIWRNALNFVGFSKLGANFIFLVAGTLAGMATLRLFGSLIDRFGRRPIIIICTFGTMLTILPWAFIMPDTPNLGINGGLNWLFRHGCAMLGLPPGDLIAQDAPIGAFMLGICAASIGGAAWGGMSLAQANFMFRFNDLPGRSRFMASLAVFASLGGLIGGLTGGALTHYLEFLQNTPIVIGPLRWNNWHIAFMVSAAFRLTALYWLLRLPEVGHHSVADVTRHLAANLYGTTVGRLFKAS